MLTKSARGFRRRALGLYLCKAFRMSTSIVLTALGTGRCRSQKVRSCESSTSRCCLSRLRSALACVSACMYRVGTSVGVLTKLKRAANEGAPIKRQRVRPVDAMKKMTAPQMARLRKLVCVANPPTQKAMALQFNCSQKTIRNAIKKLGMRLVKKPKCHAMTEATKEKRRKRSRPLYRRLCNERWRRYVTSDEAWVYLTDAGGQRSVQYISRDSKRSSAEPAVHVEHPTGVMIWVAISTYGVSKPLCRSIPICDSVSFANVPDSLLRGWVSGECRAVAPSSFCWPGWM